MAQVLTEVRRGRAQPAGVRTDGFDPQRTARIGSDTNQVAAEGTPPERVPSGSRARKRLGVAPRLGYRAEVAELVAQVADGLHYAHCQGIVHRDVKPSNVLVGADGRPRLTDFGLAKDLIDPGETLSRSGELTGTPHYMSPEQTLARRAPIDQRTDVFSLGVILYELLTLRRPFDGEDLQQLILQICFHDPPPIARINADVPRDLATICSKALERDPDRRYQTADEMAQDLRSFLEFRPIKARPSGWVTRSFKVLRRHRTATVALSAAVLTAAAGLVWSRMEAANARQLAEEQLTQAEAALDDGAWDRANELALAARSRRPDDEDVRLRGEAVTLAIEAQRQARERRRAEGERLFAQALREQKTDSDRAIQLALAGVERRPGPEGSAVVLSALKDWRRSHELVIPGASVSYFPRWVDNENSVIVAWPRAGLFRFDARELTRTPVELAVRGKTLRTVTVSADGTRFAAIAYQPRLATVIDAASGRVLRIQEFSGRAAMAAALSSDGALLASASGPNSTIDVLDVDSGVARTLEEGVGFVEALEFDPRARFLVATLRDNSVRIYDLEDGGVDAFGGREGPPVICTATIDSAGEWFAHVDEDDVVVRTLATGAELHRVRVGSTPRALAARPRAPGAEYAELAIGGDDGIVTIWDLVQGRVVRSMLGDPSRVVSLAFSGNGRRLAVATRNLRAHLFDCTDGRHLMEAPGARSGSTRVQLNHDGSQMIVDGQRTWARLWKTTADQAVLDLTGHIASPRTLEIDEQEQLLVSASQSVIRIWDPADGSQRAELPLAAVVGATWRGRRLVVATADAVQEFDRQALLQGAKGLEPERRVACAQPILALLAIGAPEPGSAAGPLRYLVRDHSKLFSIGGAPENSVRIEYPLRIADLAADRGWRFAVSSHHETFARLRSLADGSERKLVSPGGVVQCVAIDRNGRTCLSADDRGSVRVFGTANAELRYSVSAGTHRVTAAAFDPSGEFFATGSEDGVCRVFRTADGAELTRFRAHRVAVVAIRFLGSDRVVSSDILSAVRVWPARPIELAKNLPLRPLSLTDRQRFGVLKPGDAELLARIDALDREYLLKRDVRARLREELVDQPARLALALDHVRDMRLGVRNRMVADMPWAMVSAEQSKEVVANKLRLAEAAVRLSPGEWSFRRNLAMAQYRSGRFQAALETLDLVAEMAHTPANDPLITSFSAMTLARLGKGAPARTALGRLEEILAEGPGAVPPALASEVRTVVGAIR